MDKKELELAAKHGIKVLTMEHPHYPPFLKEVADAPKALYVKGDTEILARSAMALVGTRTPTLYGLRSARNLSESLVRCGLVTVSGLARGIDTVVHQSTLKAGGKTIAVLGGGLLNLYPPENKNLALAIALGGAVISEFPLLHPTEPWCFPKRNRIISALCYGTIVVEGDIKSGALITAKYALEQGRDVFAVPGPIDSKMSEGPNYLIQQGAKLVLSVEDILEEIPILREQHFYKIQAKGAHLQNKSVSSSEEQGLLDLLSDEAMGMDRILVKSGKPIGQISKTLLDLERKGAVQPLPGGRYGRI